MQVREMKPGDIAACADILCSVYNNPLWQCRWEKDTAIAYLTDFFHMPKFLGFVAEENGVIFAGLFAREKVWWNNSEIFVEEMFVKPEYQGKGYGSLLLKRVEAYAAEKGLAGITLSTNRYAPAKGFYQKHGFSDCEHVLFMCKKR